MVVVAVEEVVVVRSGLPGIGPSCSSVASMLPSTAASGHCCCCCCWDHGEEASVGFSIDKYGQKDLKNYFYPYKQLTTISNKQTITQ